MKIKYNPNNLDHNDIQKYIIHNGTIFDHVIEVLRNSKTKDPITNLALLFHDVQKPMVKTIEDRKPKYHGHDDPNLGLIDKICNRLKLSNEYKEAIIFSLQNHMIGHKLDELKKSKLLNLRQNKNWDVLRHTIYADEASRGSSKFDPNDYETRMQQVEDIAKKFGEKQEFEKKMSGYVDGRIIMNIVPLIKGVDIGKIKDATREWIIAQDFNVTQENVVKYVKQLARELGYTA